MLKLAVSANIRLNLFSNDSIGDSRQIDMKKLLHILVVLLLALSLCGVSSAQQAQPDKRYHQEAVRQLSD
jgi:hypothetical protein